MSPDGAAADAIPTTGSKQLPPDPRSLEALGRHHSLEAALAELVDNSLDARAKHVLIRFVRDGGRLVRVIVADDGRGISEKEIDAAMTIGGGRAYKRRDIGRFGLGLKAASFSQAHSVTLVSRARGRPAVGRRWELEHAKRDYRCEIVAEEFCEGLLGEDWGFPRSTTGTVVRWDDVKGFPSRGGGDAVDRFLQGAFSRIRTHLGLTFHRLLEQKAAVFLDVEDDSQGVLLRTEVAPLDPFGYSRSGAAGFPKALVGGRGRGRLSLECHVWPGRSTADEFKLDGSPLERQGLYVYFNDRLVQRGGWNGLVHPDKQLNLARVALDVKGDVDGVLKLNPEKRGIEVGPEFASTVHAAKAADGTTFDEYVEGARRVFKEANRRRRVRPAIVPPGAGFDPRLRRAFRRELPFKEDDPVDIRWASLPAEEFFEIDREQNVLWLNRRYRRALLGSRRGGLNDLPVMKALLYLLMEHIFAGQNLGPRDKDNLEVWQSLLLAAVKAEAK